MKKKPSADMIARGALVGLSWADCGLAATSFAAKVRKAEKEAPNAVPDPAPRPSKTAAVLAEIKRLQRAGRMKEALKLADQLEDHR